MRKYVETESTDLEKWIVENYPYMMYNREEFKEHYYPDQEIAPYYDEAEFIIPSGCGCGTGWWTLVTKLIETIDWHIDSDFQQQEWKKNKGKLDGEPTRMFFKINQVKEKFGGLRFYINGGDDYIRGLIMMAEVMSTKICYFTGHPAKKREIDGWYFTASDEVYERKLKEHKERRK
jgi:hypothetical protein